jgi:hypothetical protein
MKIHPMGVPTSGGAEPSGPAASAASVALDAAPPRPAASAAPASTVGISSDGGLLSELSLLKSCDPEKFRARLHDMAQRLRAAAIEVGEKDAPALERLAEKMTEAAQSGELAVLRPPALGGRRAA